MKDPIIEVCVYEDNLAQANMTIDCNLEADECLIFSKSLLGDFISQLIELHKQMEDGVFIEDGYYSKEYFEEIINDFK